MHRSSEPASRPLKVRTLARVAASVLFSAMLGLAGPAVAEPHGGGFHGGNFHGGGFHGGGFHGGEFHGGGFHGGGFHGGFHGRGFEAGRFHGGFYRGFYPGLGLGLAFGVGYPWGWGYYPPDYSYYGYAAPYTATRSNWYYCSNPAGYYPYVTQCYGLWQVVPAS